jgi:hypothetical protein
MIAAATRRRLWPRGAAARGVQRPSWPGPRRWPSLTGGTSRAPRVSARAKRPWGRARRAASAHGGGPDRPGGHGRAHGVDAQPRERAGPGAVADRAACQRLARALSTPAGLRGPGVIAWHAAGCHAGGDRAAAGRLVPAAPAACPGGLLPAEASPVGHAEGDRGHRASARPRALHEADARPRRRASASGGRCTTRPRPEGPACDAPGQGVGRCLGEHLRGDA